MSRPAAPRRARDASLALRDADGDQVPDDVDQCDDRPAPGTLDGCPAVIAIVFQGGCTDSELAVALDEPELADQEGPKAPCTTRARAGRLEAVGVTASS